MKRTKLETARLLAKGHFQVEPQLKRVHLIESDDDHDLTIKLLEVVEGTIERGIEPIAFPPDLARGIEYPSEIIEVSPREYADILAGKLDLGSLGKMGQELPA